MTAIKAQSTCWPDMAAAIERSGIAILPIGAMEQHGAHLPLATDTILASGVAECVADQLDAILLPAISYGEAWNNSDFTGTMSLSPETLRAILRDLGREWHRVGGRALIVMNGHFGNSAPIDLAARDLLTELKLPVLNLDYPNLSDLAEHICHSKPAAPGFYHADEVETSMMLVFAPELVDMDRAEPEYPEFPVSFGYEQVQLREFNSTGVFGDPRPATAEKGQQLIDGIVANALNIILAFKTRNGV